MEPPATLAAEAVLRIWEQGRAQHPLDRALTILAVLTGQARGDLAAMSVERRDRMLLSWRTRMFGDVLGGYAACPRCGCGVDVSLTVDDAPEPDERFLVDIGGASLAVRLPTSRDLLAVAGCDSAEVARRALARRCLAEDERGPLPQDDEVQVSEAVATAIEAELDRRAGIGAGVVILDCPDCGHRWQTELDIATFTWREIEILAGRLLRHVDVLARRYGWSEQEILRLSPARRRFYLELAS